MASKKPLSAGGALGQKLDGLNPDVVADKLAALRALVPEAFVEGKLDAGVLTTLFRKDSVLGVGKEALAAAGDGERFGLSWAGKHLVYEEIAKQSHCTLTLNPTASRPKSGTGSSAVLSDNLFIEGENLEVLRTLQKAYHNKVKMIYIDPPYNTGKDFVYHDNFRQTEEEYCDECNINADGYLTKAFKLNTKDSGRYHSNWLNMMYPRLYLARNLLRDDGVIFVSIDDHEVHNLRHVMNEIFGEENFISQVIWKKKRGKDNSAKYLSRNHEYLICFAKTNDLATFSKLELEQETKNAYRNPDSDSRGDYRLLGAWARGTQGGSKFSYIANDGQVFTERLWLMNQDSLRQMDNDKRLVFNGDKVYRKLFLSENTGNIPETIWDTVSNAANAADEIKKLFDFQIFDTVKPTPYIQRMLQLVTNADDIVLDFFSGSGTTAHAVMAQNAQDGGKRHYICVQMPEVTPEGSEARKAGYNKISDIAIERIKRASAKVQTEHPDYKGDLGVRVYRATDSHFPYWRAKARESSETLLQEIIDYANAKPTGTPAQRVDEVLLKLGLPLTTTLIDQGGFVLAGSVALVLDEKFKASDLMRVFDSKPTTVVVLEQVFKKDEEKINFDLRCIERQVIFQTI